MTIAIGLGQFIGGGPIPAVDVDPWVFRWRSRRLGPSILAEELDVARPVCARAWAGAMLGDRRIMNQHEAFFCPPRKPPRDSCAPRVRPAVESSFFRIGREGDVGREPPLLLTSQFHKGRLSLKTGRHAIARLFCEAGRVRYAFGGGLRICCRPTSHTVLAACSRSAGGGCRLVRMIFSRFPVPSALEEAGISFIGISHEPVTSTLRLGGNRRDRPPR